jgi:hypothetical protein
MSRSQVNFMRSVPHRWFGTTARLGSVALAALLLASALLRAGDEPAADNPQVFRDEGDVVPPLNQQLLDRVIDSRRLPELPERIPSEKDKAQYAAYLQQLDEYQAYCEALVKAAHCSPKAFADSANRELTYAHLFNEPRKYRGRVVHFEGRLKRVRRFDPPLMLSQAGVKDLYEGWMFSSERYGANPVCLVFTDLPPGIQVSEDTWYPVAFDGYFFKKYRYSAGDTKPGQAREVPLLIGRAPVLTESAAAEPAAPWTWSHSMLVALLVLVVGTLALGFGLHWWFRRGDNRVRRRLAQAPREFVPPPPEAPAGAGPGGGAPQAQEFPAPTRWPPDPSAS